MTTDKRVELSPCSANSNISDRKVKMTKIHDDTEVQAVCPISLENVHFLLHPKPGKFSDGITVDVRFGRPEWQPEDQRCVPEALRQARDMCVARNAGGGLATADADICELIESCVSLGFLPRRGEYSRAFSVYGREPVYFEIGLVDFSEGFLSIISARIYFDAPLKIGRLHSRALEEAVQLYLATSTFLAFDLESQNAREIEAAFAELLNIKRRIQLGLNKIIVRKDVLCIAYSKRHSNVSGSFRSWAASLRHL